MNELTTKIIFIIESLNLHVLKGVKEEITLVIEKFKPFLKVEIREEE